MKPMTRIATAAAALALIAAPATFASERSSHRHEQAAHACACMAEHAERATPEKAAQPSTPEHPRFTDQG